MFSDVGGVDVFGLEQSMRIIGSLTGINAHLKRENRCEKDSYRTDGKNRIIGHTDTPKVIGQTSGPIPVSESKAWLASLGLRAFPFSDVRSVWFRDIEIVG